MSYIGTTRGYFYKMHSSSTIRIPPQEIDGMVNLSFFAWNGVWNKYRMEPPNCDVFHPVFHRSTLWYRYLLFEREWQYILKLLTPQWCHNKVEQHFRAQYQRTRRILYSSTRTYILEMICSTDTKVCIKPFSFMADLLCSREAHASQMCILHTVVVWFFTQEVQFILFFYFVV